MLNAAKIVNIRVVRGDHRFMVGLVGTRELVQINGYGDILSAPRVWSAF